MKQLMESIQYNSGIFPKKELLQIIERKEEAAPYLMELVRAFIDNPEQYIIEASRIDLLYALYLLSQFREKQLFPELIKLLQLPEETLDLAIGDALTEGTGRMLASVFNGDVQALYQLIENVEADLFVRGQGMLALTILVLEGVLERSDIVAYLGSLLSEDKLNEDNFEFNGHVVYSCIELHPFENYEVIRDAFEKDKIDTSMINLENVEEAMNGSLEQILDKSKGQWNNQLITNTISEMEWWGCFEKSVAAHNPKTTQSRTFGYKATPVVKLATPGRNEPCSCGSGLKYKKCCGK
ncbi:DUF1186 domain-containing protein [Paenibacillus luteus]|uniref:DUF1186 domain-containing protein n=1 Tax=Paenibacillus luteus TaxID=2545753 RepID=UPI001144D897|nr:DUF1186 domain-containing protein [Paenibacillus luteus]